MVSPVAAVVDDETISRSTMVAVVGVCWRRRGLCSTMEGVFGYVWITPRLFPVDDAGRGCRWLSKSLKGVGLASSMLRRGCGRRWWMKEKLVGESWHEILSWRCCGAHCRQESDGSVSSLR